ncbi:parB-like partition s domain protein [Escherichia coli P0304777.4]|nr:parB-like partition s domain protein [Escherichia coli P0304777.4]
MKDNRWVPGWMCTPRPQTDTTETVITWLMPPDEQPHRPAGDGAAAREIP